jgi:N-acetylglucosaminyl-diphospho-decaprenol L-rhamnosyltransferase
LSAPDVSIVIVSHRSAAEASRCVASLRRDLASSAIDGEIVVVDCASGEEERTILRGVATDRLVLLDDNRGYSGGVNAGLARAGSTRVVLSNADVVYRPGALAALLAAIAEPSVAAAAPVVSWDEEGRLLLPPGFAPGFWTDVSERCAGRWPVLDDRRFARFARRTLALWRHGGDARHLSGAVLAVRRDVFDRIGRFDERFTFEYEETEWEDRARAAGLRLVVSPAARVRHLWAVSSSRSPGVEQRRAASARLYRHRRYGRFGLAILDRIAPARPSVPPPLDRPRVAAAPGRWLAISPNPSRLPFAACDLESDFELPGEIARSIPAGPWRFTTFAAEDGRPVQNRVWEPSA